MTLKERERIEVGDLVEVRESTYHNAPYIVGPYTARVVELYKKDGTELAVVPEPPVPACKHEKLCLSSHDSVKVIEKSPDHALRSEISDILSKDADDVLTWVNGLRPAMSARAVDAILRLMPELDGAMKIKAMSIFDRIDGGCGDLIEKSVDTLTHEIETTSDPAVQHYCGLALVSVVSRFGVHYRLALRAFDDLRALSLACVHLGSREHFKSALERMRPSCP